MKRLLLAVVMVCFMIPAWAGEIPAQEVPWNIGVDSSLRLGFLFGRNTILFKDPLSTNFQHWRMDFGPQLALVSGSCELSPFRRVSVRAACALSMIETSTVYYFTQPDPIPISWDITPKFYQGDVAGLYHLWTGGGYRFSVVGGYRYDNWKFQGPQHVGSSEEFQFRETLVSHIPFMGLQTAVFFPWWKARFEVRGSPFMVKRITTYVHAENAREVQYTGWADDGGLMEFELEGTVGIATNVRVGVYAKYSYQELSGQTTRQAADNVRQQDVFAQESFGLLAFNLAFVF